MKRGRGGNREGLLSLGEGKGVLAGPDLANRSSPLQTPRCGLRSTCGSGWSGQ